MPVLRLPAVMKEQPHRTRGAKWEAPSTWGSRLSSCLAAVAGTALCIPCLCPKTSPEDNDSDSESDYFESPGAGGQTGGEESEVSSSEGNAGRLPTALVHNTLAAAGCLRQCPGHRLRCSRRLRQWPKGEQVLHMSNRGCLTE